MDFKTLLAVGLALVALQLCSAQPVKRSCACNLRGIDACGCVPVATIKPTRVRGPGSVGQRVVVQKFAAPQLSPIGDVCTCRSGGLIQSAVVPRIPCKVHSKSYEASASSDDYFSGNGCDEVPSNPCEDNTYESRVTTYTVPAKEETITEELVEEPIRTRSGPIPADAVSLAIAHDIATRQNKNIKEELLSFGPLQKPADGVIKVKKTYVPEAGLHQLRNEVVELRAPSGFSRSCEDEADASLLAAQDSSCGEVEDSGFNGRLLTYNDLGFTSVKKPCNFVKGSFTPSSPIVEQTVEYVVPAGRPRAPAPVYTACDALSTLDSGAGRGSSGYDGYENANYDEADSAAPCDEAESSGYGPAPTFSAQSYLAPAPAAYGHYSGPSVSVSSRSHSRGKSSCSCGCKGGY